MGVQFEQVLQAHQRIRDHVHRTPVMTSRQINEITGVEAFFKCDNLQRVGAFKIRGAANAVFSLTEAEAAKGVTTHSSGNFAAALALAASWRQIPATVVMPRTAPAVKKQAVAGYGAQIRFCEPTVEAREGAVEELIAESGATFIHPYDDDLIIAGQGTAALELCQEIEDLEVMIAPVGGGGLAAGTALAVRGTTGIATIMGAEPALADDAHRSLALGAIQPAVKNPGTIADGLLTCLGQRTFPILKQHLAEIILVDEATIVRAMRLIWERMKMVVEPSAAITLGAVLLRRELLAGKRVGLILSGGNVDLDRLPWMG